MIIPDNLNTCRDPTIHLVKDKEQPFSSYAQNQEDVLLWRIFKSLPTGFYVDVGAAHPEWESVTKAFYDRGWRGINIEPNPHFYELLTKERTRDINICALAGGKSGTRNLNIVGSSGLSTAAPKSVDLLQEAGHEVTKVLTSKVVRLDEILKKQGIKEIHFLKIDVEGMEREVLDGCDFSEFRPKVLIIEATLPETNIRIGDEIRQHLATHGYECVFFDGLNDYFVSSECIELGKKISYPVNALDHYKNATELYFLDRVTRVEGVENRSQLTSQDVDWAYRHFFSRSPESDEVVNGHIASHQNLRDFIETITNSREYRYKINTRDSKNSEELKYYYFHIPKTGGMSVHDYLYDNVLEGELLPGYLIEDLISTNSSNFKYISGHFHSLPLNQTNREFRISTVLRNPIDRSVSHFEHAQRDCNVPFHKYVKGFSFEDFIYSTTAVHMLGNRQARMLAELSLKADKFTTSLNVTKISDEELYDLAMDALSKMELVGITERLEDFIAQLSKKWSLPMPTKEYRVNRRPDKKPSELSDQVIVKINEMCSVDIKIYEHIKNSL